MITRLFLMTTTRLLMFCLVSIFVFVHLVDGFLETWALAKNGIYFQGTKLELDGYRSPRKCVAIPENMTLCHGLKYSEMKLPNLLEHVTMNEAVQQSSSWIPLVTSQCHQDTQLFLCSLFAPVCVQGVDQLIYPCRSLCEQVRGGCAKTMAQHGFPWPESFNCDLFPMDNDMCVPPMAKRLDQEQRRASLCKACTQEKTWRNVRELYCESDFAIRTRISRKRGDRIFWKKSRVLRVIPSHITQEDRNFVLQPKFDLSPDRCCADLEEDMTSPYLIFGKRGPVALETTLIMPLKKNDKVTKKWIRLLRKLDCVEGSGKRNLAEGKRRRDRRHRGK